MEILTGNFGKQKTQTYHLLKFDNLSAIAEFAIANPNPQSSDRRSDSHYNSTKSLAEAHKLAMHGWHDSRSQVDGHLEPLRESLGTLLDTETVRFHDMVGYEPDIDRFIAGEMECMWDDMMVEAPKEGKVFRLLVDCSMAWTNEASDILKRGAVLCALVEAYSMLGLQLEVWCESTVRGYETKDYGTMLTKINSAGDPIDIDSMMFALGHPDYNRRLQWSVGEQLAPWNNQFGFGTYYGLNLNGAHMADYVEASAVVSLDGNSAMTRDSLGWILDQLEAQGVWERPDGI